MRKLLIIIPHLSTGGAPEVVSNKISLIKDDFIIKVVEWGFISWEHVVQRNKIIDMVGSNFISLGEKKQDLIDLVNEFQPDVISMEEFPEFFMDDNIAEQLYKPDRNYKIIETTHDSSFNKNNKRFFPDQFCFVSSYSAFQYIDFKIPIDVIEYPIDKKIRNKSEKRNQLGLEHDIKHIVIVGLFTERKNQKYAFEIAKKLSKYPIKFHFLGNQAGNFESYWKPLMENKPDNCIVWGERKDVIDFIEASDMFLFCSRGHKHNKELNPIAIKEAMQYQDLPKLMYNLDVYCNKYNEYDNIFYLTSNLEMDSQKVVEILDVSQERKNEELIVIGTYPNLKERVRLTKECINRLKPLSRDIMVVSHYPVDEETQKMCDYYIYDSHNPLTHHSYYTKFFNHTHFYDAEININALKNSNQSLTVLTNLFNAFKEAKSRGYKRVFYTTFDVLVDEKDLKEIETSFSAIGLHKAYFGAVSTPFGYGVETTAMTFDVNYFLESFDDVRNIDEYNHICEQIGSQNFLEDYMIKKLKSKDDYLVIFNEHQTFLENSGRGVSSNSEYYSIIPIDKSENEFMFYFYTYNIDERKVNLTIIEDGLEIFNTRFQLSNTREYKKEFKYNRKPTQFILDFYDGDNKYKTETYEINNYNLEKYKNTGIFRWKNQKPKIKLVHLQTTIDDERQRLSRESVERVKDYGWEYVLHTNVPYGNVPPSYNCIRPNCVSSHIFDEATIQKLGTALTPAHYGCFESFKNAILSEFTNDIDFLMVCEGDCLIESDLSEFIAVVERCSQTMIEKNIGMMSFGDKDTLEQGWPQSNVIEEVNETMYITNHIIGLQSIMFPKFANKWLKETLRTHKWDAADIYFNIIMSESPYKMGIVHNRLTTQADGFSLIDNTYKSFRKK